MKKYLSALVTASVASLTLFSSALAAPVTSADLSGKKLCMSNGDRNAYNSGGQFSSNRFGNGTWAVTADGVQIYAQYWNGLFSLTKRSNGTFRSTYTLGNYPKIVTGRYCN